MSNDINEDSRPGTEEEDTDVPEEIETALEELFTALQDKVLAASLMIGFSNLIRTQRTRLSDGQLRKG